MTDDMLKYFKERGVVPSGNAKKLISGIMRRLYEWGSLNTWDLTGGETHHRSALRACENAGLAVDEGRYAYVTDEGMSFVERFKLSGLA